MGRKWVWLQKGDGRALCGGGIVPKFASPGYDAVPEIYKRLPLGRQGEGCMGLLSVISDKYL